MSDIKGCTNHGCLVSPLPKGAMGTNAICQCMRNPITAQRVAQDRLRLRARVAELEAALQKAANLLHAGEITVAAITAFTALADKELGKARGLPTTCGSPRRP